MTDIMITLTINGESTRVSVAPRTSLADMLRDDLALTGTHLGCEQGVCGACTVLVDELPVRACLTLAMSCDGSEVVTVEGLQGADAERLRTHFSTEGALQCGFCTSGMLMTGFDVVRRREPQDEASVRSALSGNICRCTGYQGLVRAITAANDDGITAETTDH